PGPLARTVRANPGCQSNFDAQIRKSRAGSAAGAVDRPRDETRAALIGQERPRPLEENEDAVAETDQKQDVHEAPDEPSGEPGQAQATDPRDRLGPADDGEVPLVAVAERTPRPAGQVCLHVSGDVA